MALALKACMYKYDFLEKENSIVKLLTFMHKYDFYLRKIRMLELFT